MDNEYKRVVKFEGQLYRIMILPIFSLSTPNKYNESRMVFDWGKSLSHPSAKIGFAFIASGQYINRIIFDDHSYYLVNKPRKCRSGRLSARVVPKSEVDPNDLLIISTLLDSK